MRCNDIIRKMPSEQIVRGDISQNRGDTGMRKYIDIELMSHTNVGKSNFFHGLVII